MSLPGARARPCVAPALIFLAGIALAWGHAPLAASLAGAAWLGGTVVVRARAVGVIVVLACLGAGYVAATAARHAAHRRAAWLPEDGAPVELDLDGIVLAAPEPVRTGERLLRIRGRPVGAPRAGRPAAEILLRVQPSGVVAHGPLERLRRGDRIRVWARLRRPRAPGNPGEAEGRRALLAGGLDATGSVKNERLVVRRSRGRPSLSRVLDDLRARARTRLRRAFPRDPRTYGTLAAMLLGDRHALAPNDERRLRDAGLVHLIAISGLHAGLVVLLLGAVLRRALPRLSASHLVAVPLLLGFAFAVGGRPPVLRAVGCACAVLAGRSLHREGNALNTLAVVAAILVGWHPWMLWGAGFQLSFLAAAGILAMVDAVRASLPLPGPLALPLAVTLSAYAAAAPLVAARFGVLAPVALASNLVAVPATGMILAAGAASIATQTVPGLGTITAHVASGAVRFLWAVAALASAEAGVPCRVAPPHAGTLAAYYLLLCLALRLRATRAGSSGRAIARVVVLGIVIVLGCIHLGVLPPGPYGGAWVAVLDVGQGQAVLVRGPRGCVLVDAGGTSGGRFDRGERVVAPQLARAGCGRVEAVVLSHDHDDHAGGAAAVLREFEVGELWVGLDAVRRTRTRALSNLARSRGAALVGVSRGFHAHRAGLEIGVLHPGRDDAGGLDLNNRSVVVRVCTGVSSVLVAGDLETPGELSLMRAGASAGSRALVVGHHGSPRGTSASFLAAVHPEVAVISVGAGNRFGHPGAEVLRRLREAGVEIYRTDREGLVRMRATAKGWRVETPMQRGDEGDDRIPPP